MRGPSISLTVLSKLPQSLVLIMVMFTCVTVLVVVVTVVEVTPLTSPVLTPPFVVEATVG